MVDTDPGAIGGGALDPEATSHGTVIYGAATYVVGQLSSPYTLAVYLEQTTSSGEWYAVGGSYRDRTCPGVNECTITGVFHPTYVYPAANDVRTGFTIVCSSCNVPLPGSIPGLFYPIGGGLGYTGHSSGTIPYLTVF
jgi:hypothetical protein